MTTPCPLAAMFHNHTTGVKVKPGIRAGEQWHRLISTQMLIMTQFIQAHSFTFLPLGKYDKSLRDSYHWVYSTVQAHRTVKANSKPGGFAAEWSRTSPGHTKSTSHIPAAFAVCMRVTDDEGYRLCMCVRERRKKTVTEFVKRETLN